MVEGTCTETIVSVLMCRAVATPESALEQRFVNNLEQVQCILPVLCRTSGRPYVLLYVGCGVTYMVISPCDTTLSPSWPELQQGGGGVSWVQAAEVGQAGLVENLQGMWCDAVVVLVGWEWPHARQAIWQPGTASTASAVQAWLQVWHPSLASCFCTYLAKTPHLDMTHLDMSEMNEMKYSMSLVLHLWYNTAVGRRCCSHCCSVQQQMLHTRSDCRPLLISSRPVLPSCSSPGCNFAAAAAG